jgi:membrane associated rhomboid family serine protease
MAVEPGPSDHQPRGGYVERLLAGPGVSLLLMSAVTIVALTVARASGAAGMFVLQAPLSEGVWQIPLSVFAHVGMAHLTANAVMVLVAGGLVVLSSTVVRYHAFFLVTGALSGIAQVVVTGLFGPPAAVLGASGAALAFVGYLLTSNAASSWLLDRVPRWMVVTVIGACGLALMLRYYAAGSANVGHLAGALLGLVAGRFNLLRPS